MSIDLNDFPHDLIKSFDTKKGRGVVAFVGSGPSCHAGLPSWGGIIKEAARRLRFLDKIKTDLKNKAFSQIADFLSSEVGEKNLKLEIVEIIREKTNTPSYLHEKIVKLNFKGIVTTNYDLLLTKADKDGYFSPPFTNKNSTLISLTHSKNPPFIFHLHGNIQDSESIVLTLNSYNEITSDKSIRHALATLFASNNVLFIGFGFDDNHIREFLTEFKKYDVIGLNVFAVIPSSELTASRKKHLRNMNVTPIELKVTKKDYGVGHLSDWLETLDNSLKQIEKAKNNPARFRLLNSNLADKVYTVISNSIYNDVLISSLKNLPDRIDLLHLCEMGLSNNDKKELLDILSPNEFRQILISANAHHSDIVLRDALSYLPPENN